MKKIILALILIISSFLGTTQASTSAKTTDTWIYKCEENRDLTRYNTYLGSYIYKVKEDGTNKKIIRKNISCGQIVNSGDWLYFNNYSDSGRLYKMKVDGTGLKKLSTITETAFITVYKDRVYFMKDAGYSAALYSVGTNGTKQITYSKKGVSSYYIVKGELFFTEHPYYNRLNKMKLNGTSKKAIFPKISAWDLKTDGSYLYYYEESNNSVVQLSLDGKKQKTIVKGLDPNGRYVVKNGWIYYMPESKYYKKNGIDYVNRTVYKMQLNGKNKSKAFSKEIEGLYGTWITEHSQGILLSYYDIQYMIPYDSNKKPYQYIIHEKFEQQMKDEAQLKTLLPKIKEAFGKDAVASIDTNWQGDDLVLNISKDNNQLLEISYLIATEDYSNVLSLVLSDNSSETVSQIKKYLELYLNQSIDDEFTEYLTGIYTQGPEDSVPGESLRYSKYIIHMYGSTNTDQSNASIIVQKNPN